MKNNMPGISGRARRIILYFFITVAVLLIFFIYPAKRALVVSDYKTGEVFYCHEVSPGDMFSISYIHSVNKSPVKDCFRVGVDYEIFIDKTVFTAFGAGVPSGPEDGGEFRVYKDRIEVAGINRRISKLLLFIGVIAEHRFMMGEDEFRLKEMSPPQSSVLISTEKLSLPVFLIHRLRFTLR